jgi:AcrR family transcriptional regulator
MSTDQTADRIVLSALKILLKQGVKRSSLSDIAFEAGVTRITVYRYFGGKAGLVESVCRYVAGVFRRVAEGSILDSSAQINARLERLGQELAHLPPGNLLALLDEIRRLYPAVSEELRIARENALDQVFEQAMAAASREGTLRDGINLQVVRAMFRAVVVELIENPSLIATGVPLAEICDTVTAVLRQGTLKGASDGQIRGELSSTGACKHG